MSTGDQEWFTPDEAAAYLRIHVNTLYDWCEKGLVKWHPMPAGRGRRFRRRDLDAAYLGPPGDDPGSRLPS